MLRFSIIIPNYNKGPYIDDCINSILNQTIDKSNYEIIFIDDGSSDNSLEVISKYKDIKLFHSDRLLAGGARNIGIKEAKGEYLVFVDSDDYLCSNEVLEKLDKHIKGEDIIFINYYKQKKDTTVLVKNTEAPISYQVENATSLGCPTKCFKKDIITLFDEKCYYEDVYFTLYAICNSKTYSYFSEPFFTYRYVEGSITKNKELSSQKMIDWLIQLSKLYYLCDLFPHYRECIINRLKRERLEDRIAVLDKYFKTGENTFHEKF